MTMTIIISEPSLIPVDGFKFLILDKFCLEAARSCSSV